MKFDDCTFCKGRVTPRYVQKPCYWGEKLVAIIDNVPAGVCEQCGERYYKANILKAIEMMLNKRQRFENSVKIPFGNFSKAMV